MSEILEYRGTPVPDAVKKRIENTVSSSPEYLKGGKPEVRAVQDARGKVEAYSVSMRRQVPDAYFDARGNLLFSVLGVFGFDGGPSKSAAARDAFRLAGFSEEITKDGKRHWYRDSSIANDPDGKSTGREEVDPFGGEAFSLIRNVAFQQDRLDILIRLVEKSREPNALHEAYSDEDISIFEKNGSVTVADLVKLKGAGLVDAKLFSAHRAAVAKRLPEQLLDPRFAASVETRTRSGSVTEIRPSWHGIDRKTLDALLRDGHLDASVHKAALESLALLDERAEILGISQKETRSKLSNLRKEVSPIRR